MTITQTVEIPVDRRLVIDVPPEIPAGKAILIIKPATEDKETVYTALTNEKAVSMTAEVINKYRPALEELAK
jgi:hypothetical protein